jgi:hypothetical protein
MVRLVNRAGSDAGTRPSSHRGLVLAAATLGFGVIQLDVSVVNAAGLRIASAIAAGLLLIVTALSLAIG